MNRRFFDLAIVGALALSAIVLSLVTPVDWTGNLVVGLLVVLVLPGYALVAAFFPAQRFTLPEQTLLVLACSIASTILGGLLLNLTTWGLRRASWVALLGGIALIAVAVAVIRRRRSDYAGSPASLTPHFSLHQWLMLGCAAAVIGGTVALVHWDASQQNQTRFTQLWAVPDQIAPESMFRIGVANLEAQEVTYRALLRSEGRAVQEWNPITLQAGMRWETTVDLEAQGIQATAVDVVLFRHSDPEVVYRRVVLRNAD